MPNQITRREFVKTAAVGTVGMAGIIHSGCAPGSLSRKRPNIVLVTIDTQRYDRLGFNGYSRDTSPFLDSIAGKGVIYDSNYSQSHFTPDSIASLLTSVYARDTGVSIAKDNTKLKQGTNWTLAEALREYGYETFGFVSMPFLDDARGFARGFDSYSSPNDSKRRGDKTVNELRRTIMSEFKGGPFFLWYHTFDPHKPYNAPDKFRLRFHTDGTFDDDKKKYMGIYTIAKLGRITEKEVVESSDHYDGQVSFADTNIKNLFDFLRAQGLFNFEKDLFVLTADHGENLGEHEHCSFHNGLYETITHVPLVMMGADLPKAKRIDALTMNLDVAPTILDIIGIKPPKIWEGQSLSGLMQNSAEHIHNVVFSETAGFDAVSARTKTLKCIHRLPPAALQDIPKKDEYYPTGRIDYYGNFPGEFVLSWPDKTEGRAKDTITDISLKGHGQASFVQLFRRYIDGVCEVDDSDALVYENGRCLKNITSFMFGEDRWNANAAMDTIFEWNVRVVRISDGDENVLHDSGPLQFGSLPTPDFRQLYDMQKDHDEITNLVRAPEYSAQLAELKNMTERFMAGKTGTTPSEGQKKLDEQDVENLRTLGYI